MKYIAVLMILANSAISEAAKPKAAPKISDPVVVKMNNFVPAKEIKLSQVLMFLMKITGGSLMSMKPQDIEKAVEAAKTMYAQREILKDIAIKRGFEKDPKYKAIFAESAAETSLNLLSKVISDSFTEAEIKAGLPKFLANSRKLLQFKFKILKVDNQRVAELAIKSGANFDKLVVEKSVHPSAKRSDFPGLIGPMREDQVLMEFGPDFVETLRSEKFQQGTISDKVIRTRDGKFAVIKLESREFAKPLTLEEAKPLVVNYLTNEKLKAMVTNVLKSGKVEFFNNKGEKEAKPAAQ